MSNPQVDALMALIEESLPRANPEWRTERIAALRTALEAALPSGRDGERSNAD